MMVQKQLLKKRLTITLKAEDLFDWSKLNDIKKVNFVVQNRKVNNFNRCIIASISYNFNSFKDKYNGSGSADDEINRFQKSPGAGHVKDKYTGVELDEVAGHSWIIDGYVIATLDDESHNVHVKDFYVHNNMGWDGANNGYNLLTALSSSPMAYKEGLLDLIWT